MRAAASSPLRRGEIPTISVDLRGVLLLLQAARQAFAQKRARASARAQVGGETQ
jgi:hypothetical protein